MAIESLSILFSTRRSLYSKGRCEDVKLDKKRLEDLGTFQCVEIGEHLRSPTRGHRSTRMDTTNGSLFVSQCEYSTQFNIIGSTDKPLQRSDARRNPLSVALELIQVVRPKAVRKVVDRLLALADDRANKDQLAFRRFTSPFFRYSPSARHRIRCNPGCAGDCCNRSYSLNPRGPLRRRQAIVESSLYEHNEESDCEQRRTHPFRRENLAKSCHSGILT